MTIPEMLELGPFGSLTRAPVEDVPLVLAGEGADPGWEVAIARIEANSLPMTAPAQGNTQADMPDWMSGSIDALYANIGREDGFGSREDTSSPGFHGGLETSSQADLESVNPWPRGPLPLVGLGSIGQYNKCYLWRNDNPRSRSEGPLITKYQCEMSGSSGKGLVVENHYVVYVNFVLTGDADIYVQGHTGDYQMYDGSEYGDFAKSRWVSEIDEWHTDAFTFSYQGNLGNNDFDMSWGFFKIDVSAGGNNTISVKNSIARELVGGGGDDTIEITGHGAAAERIDLRNGGNNTIRTEAWADIIGGAGNDTIVSQPTFNNGNGIRADLSAGGDNRVTLRGAASTVTLGAGNDIITVTNEWNNGGHPGNWSSARIDLSLGGNNRVDITGSTHASGPTRAHIALGSGDDFIHAGNHTVITILGANSTGSDTITLGGTAGHPGTVQTGHGHTTINWVAGNYAFEFGSGDLTMTVRGDVHNRFVFDGSGRSANDSFTLNNWREGGVIHIGDGHTDVALNYGVYDFHLGRGSANMSVNGHQGFSTIYDADGNLIVGRVDGQSPVAQAVHTFSAGEGINLKYSLQLGGGVDKVQFYAGSGNYQVTSSANRDIFQLDFLTGGTVGAATYEVFDFKWGSDRIMDEYGGWMDEMVFSALSGFRFQYMGERAEGHAFDLIAIFDVGNYEAGHVWMTVYSYNLPDLNFV